MRKARLLSSLVLICLLAACSPFVSPGPTGKASPVGGQTTVVPGHLPINDAPDVVLKPAVSYPFEGWGTSLAWWAEALGEASGLPAIENALFTLGDQNNPGVGLNIVRYNW
jgi:hypothetical protein